MRDHYFPERYKRENIKTDRFAKPPWWLEKKMTGEEFIKLMEWGDCWKVLKVRRRGRRRHQKTENRKQKTENRKQKTILAKATPAVRRAYEGD
jgi:hypothetical protein